MSKIKKKIKKKVKKTGADVRSPLRILDYGVSQSMILRWLRCRMEAWYYIHGWRLPYFSMARDFGSLTHDINQGLYDGVRNGEFVGVPSPEIQKKYIDLATKKLMADINMYGPKAAQDAELMLGWADAIVGPYCEFWADDFKKGIWLGLESEGTTTWNGFKLQWRIDGLKRIKPKMGPQSIQMMETKTKGRIEEDSLMDALDFDFQNEFYLTGAENELGGDGPEIRGVLYNVIRRPGQKLGAKETIPEYVERVREDIHKRPDHYFKRFEIAYPKKERIRFKGELLIKLQQFELWLKGEAPTYRQECSCTMGRKCDYLSACSSGTMKGYVQAKDLKAKKKKGGR